MCERSQDLAGEKVQKNSEKQLKIPRVDMLFVVKTCDTTRIHAVTMGGQLVSRKAASKLTYLADSRLIKSGRR